jgi:fatty acid-binding protein DegV
LLGLRPIIADKDGEIVPVANVRSGEEAYQQAMALLKSKLGQGEGVRLGLVEMGTDGANGNLDRVGNELRRRFDVVESIRAPATGVIGVHAGPGCLGGLLPAG